MFIELSKLWNWIEQEWIVIDCFSVSLSCEIDIEPAKLTIYCVYCLSIWQNNGHIGIAMFLGNFDRNLQLQGHFSDYTCASNHVKNQKITFPKQQLNKPVNELMVFSRICTLYKVCKNVPCYEEAIRELLAADWIINENFTHPALVHTWSGREFPKQVQAQPRARSRIVGKFAWIRGSGRWGPFLVIMTFWRVIYGPALLELRFCKKVI